ncbi:tail fiber assembly protein [Serratia fonticola]|uniref:tail fiber assembly protein n=1 Tax=Serratia fonticola TaxID=47917 RepID=UPI0016450F50|nr:tail fiber assembly protein [Serratia fonticola]MBC3228369.1 tail fiber assembly protein [Serratia fonticola]
MELINLQRYVPDDYFFGEGVQYFKDSTGKDWFKSINNFTKKYALAIENDTRIIRSISEDVSRIYPVGLTVVEVDGLPDGCDISGDWVFKNGHVEQRELTQQELFTLATRKKNELMIIATSRMAPLQDAEGLGIATNIEIEQLNVWKNYRVKLNRIDVMQAPHIDWPISPED